MPKLKTETFICERHANGEWTLLCPCDTMELLPKSLQEFLDENLEHSKWFRNLRLSRERFKGATYMAVKHGGFYVVYPRSAREDSRNVVFPKTILKSIMCLFVPRVFYFEVY